MKIRTTLFKVSCAIYVCGFALYVIIRQYYTVNFPRTPLGERVVPMAVNYGRTVYATAKEASVFTYIEGLFLIGIIVTLFSLWPARRARGSKTG